MSAIDKRQEYSAYRSLYRVVSKTVSGVLDGLNERQVFTLLYIVSYLARMCRLYALINSSTTGEDSFCRHAKASLSVGKLSLKGR
jgi:hypothetical protein